MREIKVGQYLRELKAKRHAHPPQVLNEERPMFSNLGEMAKAITLGIEDAYRRGVKGKSVHVNPKMKEIMDTLAGYTIKNIGAFPIVANEQCPMENFMVEKA